MNKKEFQTQMTLKIQNEWLKNQRKMMQNRSQMTWQKLSERIRFWKDTSHWKILQMIQMMTQQQIQKAFDQIEKEENQTGWQMHRCKGMWQTTEWLQVELWEWVKWLSCRSSKNRNMICLHKQHVIWTGCVTTHARQWWWPRLWNTSIYNQAWHNSTYYMKGWRSLELEANRQWAKRADNHMIGHVSYQFILNEWKPTK